MIILKSFLYNLAVYVCIKKGKISQFIANKYKLETSNSDVYTIINKHLVKCPFSHKLPFYQRQFPKYDRQLPIICKWLEKVLRRELTIIDVGANIGDTVINIGGKGSYYILFEGNYDYYKYIKYNLKDYKYNLESCYLSDVSGERVKITNHDGTGSLKIDVSEVNDCNDISISLDDIIRNKYSSVRIDLIKIDTDGFDFKVIRGASNLLRTQHPLVFFEWDKYYLDQQGENYMDIFQKLILWGYSNLLIFDNYGNFISIISIDNFEQLESLMRNTRKQGCPYYYDLLCIHESQKSIIESLMHSLL